MSSDTSPVGYPGKSQNGVHKILIADDQEKNRYLLQVLLGANGYLVTAVDNGQEVLNKLKSEDFDAIISDILMPVIDGFKLCRTIREDPKFARIPFIFYTASYTEPQDRQFGLSIGADEYITKPVEPEVFLSIIRDVFDRVMQERETKKRSFPDDLHFYEAYSEILGRD
jgi:CheY-like chemotaxis protein